MKEVMIMKEEDKKMIKKNLTKIFENIDSMNDKDGDKVNIVIAK